MQSIREAVLHLFHPRYSNHHRPRILHPEGFAMLFLFVIIFSLSIRNISTAFFNYRHILGFSSTITTQTVIDGTNSERSKLGLSQLRYNSVLSLAAQDKAKDMFEHQYWAHYSPQGKTPWDFMKSSGYRYVIAGENLARDFLDTEDMVQAWMNSPTHRDNVVNPRYQDIGVAVVNGTLNGVETTLVVQMFGSVTRNTVATTQTQTTSQQITPQPTQTVLAETTTVQPTISVLQEQQVPEQTTNINTITSVQNDTSNQVLAESLLRLTETPPPLLSPLHISKAFFLAVIILVVMVLMYDTMIIDNYQTVRFVGKNLAHIALFSVIFFLVLLFKGGVIV